MRVLKELWSFLKEHKSWWLVPGLIALLILGLLVWLANGPVLSPFLYGR